MNTELRWLGRRDYEATWREMRDYTLSRDDDSPDRIWLLEHPPVYTQGQAGRAEHVLARGDIPLVQSDRGGQVTYHGPGQLVGYVLLDLARLGFGIRTLVTRLESALVALLSAYDINGVPRRDAPGIYVDGRKIASLGLRVRRNRTYHGLSLNVDMDLEPFTRINPCGFRGLQMTQLSALGGPSDVASVAGDLGPRLLEALGLQAEHSAAIHPAAIQ